MEATPRISSEAVRRADAVIAATPGLDSLVHEMGEENLVLKPNGEFRVDAPDERSAHLLKEMFKDRNRAEQKLTDALVHPEPAPARITTGRVSLTGGWPQFDADGKVIG